MRNRNSITILAILLIIAGLITTLENFNVVSGLSKHWPLLLIILGTGFILLFFQQQKQDHALMWLGVFIGTLGIFFYYLNFTSWKSLAHIWPVFFIITGLSFASVAIFRRERIFMLSAISFISLFFVFFLIFSVSTRLWPLALLFLGIDLFIIDYYTRKVKKIKAD